MNTSLPSLYRLVIAQRAENRISLSDISSKVPSSEDSGASAGALHRPPSSPSTLGRGAPLLAAYRDALHHFWKFTAQGADADHSAVRHAYQEIIRLIDEVGEPRATELRRQWARAWHAEHGICPTCGERGPYHDPESRHG